MVIDLAFVLTIILGGAQMVDLAHEIAWDANQLELSQCIDRFKSVTVK